MITIISYDYVKLHIRQLQTGSLLICSRSHWFVHDAQVWDSVLAWNGSWSSSCFPGASDIHSFPLFLLCLLELVPLRWLTMPLAASAAWKGETAGGRESHELVWAPGVTQPPLPSPDSFRAWTVWWASSLIWENCWCFHIYYLCSRRLYQHILILLQEHWARLQGVAGVRVWTRVFFLCIRTRTWISKSLCASTPSGSLH